MSYGLARQLRPYVIRPRSIRTAEGVAGGYCLEDFMDIFRRYISRADLNALTAEQAEAEAAAESSLGTTLEWRSSGSCSRGRK